MKMSDCKVSVSSEFSIYTIFWRDEDGDVRSDSRKHINTATNLFLSAENVKFSR